MPLRSTTAATRGAHLRFRSGCVITIDANRVITEVNEETVALLGEPASTLLGQDISLHVAGKNGELFMIRALHEGDVYFAGLEEIVVRGQVFRVWSTAVPLWSNERIVGTRSTFLEFDETGDPSGDGATGDEMEALIRRILAAVAHDIRNPLAAIKGSAQLLGKAGDRGTDDREAGDIWVSGGEEMRARLAGIIGEQANRIEHVLHNFLVLASDASNRTGTVIVAEVLEQLQALIHGVAWSKGIELSVVVEPDLPAIAVDRNQLLNVILNLTENALRAAAKDGRVEIRAASAGEEILLSVTDDGPGLRPGEREQVFEPFFTTKRLGAGLGLTVSKKLVANVGGRIEVTSRPGRGCTFTVALPRSPAGAA